MLQPTQFVKNIAMPKNILTNTAKGFDWFINLLRTTQASWTYLHNIVAHEFITTWGKLISSLSQVRWTHVFRHL